MIATWAKIDGETWGVRLEDAPWPGGSGVGMPVAIRTKAGKRADVVLGAHVRTWRVAGGRFIDLYHLDSVLDRGIHAE